MYQNNRSRYALIVERRRAHKQKRMALIAAFAMAGVLLIGGTVAWLTTSTNSVVNSFSPGSIGTEVEESIDNGVKSNVAVKNTGSVESYIRATIVVNWVDASGNVVAEKPNAGTDYTMAINSASPATDSNWFVQDGYYYWPVSVASGEKTGVLINACQLTAAGEAKGYNLKVDVIASGIQTIPTSVVTTEWGVGVSDGVLIPRVTE